MKIDIGIVRLAKFAAVGGFAILMRYAMPDWFSDMDAILLFLMVGLALQSEAAVEGLVKKNGELSLRVNNLETEIYRLKKS